MSPDVQAAIGAVQRMNAELLDASGAQRAVRRERTHFCDTLERAVEGPVRTQPPLSPLDAVSSPVYRLLARVCLKCLERSNVDVRAARFVCSVGHALLKPFSRFSICAAQARIRRGA